eukprot:g4411.t1
MSRKKWAAPALAVFFLLLLSGCDSATESSSEASEEQRIRIALIMKSLANEFFINMAEGAEKHQAAHADQYELIVNGIKNESDLAQQVSLVEQMIATRADVIVIAPADSKGLLPVAKRALDLGIVVINIDNKFDESILADMGVTIPFVGPDNREGARLVGEELAKSLDPGDQVAIIGGIPGAFNAQMRQAGFEDAMQAAGIEVVAVQAADWEQQKAATITAAILTEHPQLDAILAANDSMALGAVAAVRQLGRQDQVLIVGFDNISAANDLVQSGEMLATADQYGDQLAVFGIEYALHILETGEIPEDRNTPIDLRGVRMVMQELNLFPTLSIAENISFRALSSNAGGLINHKRLDNKAKAALASFHLDHLNPRTLTSRLGVGQQQLIEIASVITDRVELLILDEPTAALTDPEIDELFFQVKRLRDQGTGIIYISHRMDEISKIADRISVLRDGELVATAKVDEINKDEIITLMAGQVVETASKKPARQTSPVPLLRVDHLGSQGSFQKICFEVNKGEVLGIGGLIGSGRTELLRAIFGADQADTGGVRLAADNFDELHKMRSPKQAIALGIGMVVEDRKTQGLLMPCSISQNISLGSLTELSKKLGILDRDQERQSAAQLAALLEVKFDQLNQAVSQLSGGNQQKILIARWLLKQLPILLFDEPTRGVDARAKQLIQNLIREQASDGKAIIVTLANQIPPLTLVAIGMTYVLIIAGIDLSVGSVLALCAAVMGVLIADYQWALPLAVFTGVLVGTLAGSINGFISARWAIPSFVVTLGMLEIARGGAYLVTGSETKYLGSSVAFIGSPLAGIGVSPALLFAVFAVLVAQFVLSKTVFGRYMIAVGTNEEAVRLSGINPIPWKVLVFSLAGLLAGLGGVFQLGYLQTADPNAGIGLELSAIAAVVIGGTSLAGGRGSVINSFLGVLIIAVMQAGLAQTGVSEPSKRIVTGLVIIIAVLFDHFREPCAVWIKKQFYLADKR